MRNVTISTVAQPAANSVQRTTRAVGVLHRPDLHADRTPLPEQQEQRQAGAQHIGRALDRPRDDLRPALLEPAARHDAVLHGKDGQQQAVDGERRRQRRLQRAVEPARHGEPADERDRVEKGGEEDQIRRHAVDEEQ